MAEPAIRTIKVYEKDAIALSRMYGGPQWRAFHIALLNANSGCLHPEAQRRYTTAAMREDGQAFNQQEQDAPMTTLAGFRCGVCRGYVFPGLRTDED